MEMNKSGEEALTYILDCKVAEHIATLTVMTGGDRSEKLMKARAQFREMFATLVTEGSFKDLTDAEVLFVMLREFVNYGVFLACANEKQEQDLGLFRQTPAPGVN